MGISNVLKGGAFGDGKLEVSIDGGELCFSSRANVDGDASGNAVNGGVDEMGGVVSEGAESSSFGAGVGEGEIGGVVGVDLEEHGGGTDDSAVVGEFCKVA